MASAPDQFAVLILFYTALFFTLAVSEVPSDQGLKVNFYETTCPNAEYLVAQEMKLVQAEDPTLMPGLVRLHFHDCFVRGCDASILLDSGSGTEEKDSSQSKSLRGFGTIERLKSILESVCPGVVLCADIITMAARDAVFLSQGPRYEIETGRRDGNVSIANETSTNLPPKDGNISSVINAYDRKNLTTKDVAVLSGAHSIGVSHCSSFSDRLYNYSGTGTTDPTLDESYAEKLKQRCPRTDHNSDKTVPMDPESPLEFGGGYFRSVMKREVVFNSDEALLHNQATRDYVAEQANAASSQQFFDDFAKSMINMGRTDVLTGMKGVIRSRCGSYY